MANSGPNTNGCQVIIFEVGRGPLSGLWEGYPQLSPYLLFHNPIGN